jgi:hypothetical protein
VQDDRTSFRDRNIGHPQASSFRAPEDDWITFQPQVKLVVVAGTFTDQLTFTVSGTGSYSTEGATDAGTNQHNLSVTAFGSIFYVIVTGYEGSDRMALGANMGNISTYDIYNNVNNGNLSIAAFGTYFASIVPGGDMGTDRSGTWGWAAFGTHLSVTVYLDSGTDSAGTVALSVFGTNLQVVYSADAGTDFFGSFAFEAYGTAQFTVPSWGTYADGTATLGFTAFGTYLSS